MSPAVFFLAPDTPAQGDEWSIELLRGIAAIMVVAAHYWPLSGYDPGLMRFLFTGVDLFFVISGFVFAPYLLGKQIVLIPYAIRRFFRIYPLYLLSLLIYTALKLNDAFNFYYLIDHLFFLHTLKSLEIAFYLNPAYWSLPPEIEFYIALPLLARIINSSSRVFYLFIIALASHLIFSYFSVDDERAFNIFVILNVHLPGLLVEFLMGSLAYLVFSRQPRKYTRLLMLVGGIVLWFSLATIFTSVFALGGDSAVTNHPVLRGNVGLFSAFAFALMLSAIAGWNNSPKNWLKSGSVMLGNLSFGLYLFHNAIPLALASYRSALPGLGFVFLCLMSSIIFSTLMYRFLEMPLRHTGRNLAAKVSL